MRRNLPLLTGILILLVAAIFIIWPQNPSNYLPFGLVLPGSQGIHVGLPGGERFDRQGMRLGLDLQGGTQLILDADLGKVPAEERQRAMVGLQKIIDRRVNAYGVAEPVIQLLGENRILVQLPGVKDVQEAVRLIGKTAQLDFRERIIKPDSTTDWQIVKGKIGEEERELTGKYFRPNSQVVFDPQTNQPQVAFEFDDEGAQLFEQITTRLVGKPLGIFLDNEVISAPTVQSVISKRGVITGLNINEARTLSIQLNSGALPVPVKIAKQEDVDATLGADSVKKSIVAGEIGLLIVILFMMSYYRFPGLLASTALLIYTAVVLAIFKLAPVTLTLAGIAGFILSIGMAVDANILIFERLREELRSGRTLRAAIEAGFDRAWTSIRDSNVSTLITCSILYWFGNNFGASLVMGFALTLAIGVVVSMFTAIIVTRTFLRSAAGFGLTRWPWLIGLPKERVEAPPAVAAAAATNWQGGN